MRLYEHCCEQCGLIFYTKEAACQYFCPECKANVSLSVSIDTCDPVVDAIYLEILALVLNELESATSKNPPFNSAHEGFAVLLEEVDELKAEVWKKPKERDASKMQREAIQVAAMGIRFLKDVGFTNKAR